MLFSTHTLSPARSELTDLSMTHQSMQLELIAAKRAAIESASAAATAIAEANSAQEKGNKMYIFLVFF